MKKIRNSKPDSMEKIKNILKQKYSENLATFVAQRLVKLDKIKAYEKLGEFMALDMQFVTVETLKNMLKHVTKEENLYASAFYKNHKDKIDIDNDRIVNPPEIAQGTYKCRNKKCNSMRTFSYQLQTRSADEPMTTFIVCADCGNKSKY